MTHDHHKLGSRTRTVAVSLACACVLGVLGSGWAASKQSPAPWQGQDLSGNDVTVPHADGPMLLIFVMAEQSRSRKAMQELVRVIGNKAKLPVLAVVSGQGAPVSARKLLSSWKWEHPIVPDPQYTLSGSMAVRARPTTVIIDRHGAKLAHIPGLPSSYQKDLEAHLQFARGEIDQDALDQRLTTNNIVASSPAQVAGRHLKIALRLMNRKQIVQAQAALERGLVANPNDLRLLKAMARVHLRAERPEAALKVLDQIGKTARINAEHKTLRAAALIALQRWDEAQPLLRSALTLNPAPAEAHYLIARVYQHQKQWQLAAEHFRSAFEHTVTARNLGLDEPQARQDKTDEP